MIKENTSEKRINMNSFSDILDSQYLEADNKKEIDYWSPLSKIIVESIELRGCKHLSQAELAKKMKTSQSVISRFENLGRIPSYDFIAKLSIALGHVPGITLYGDYMATVPIEKHDLIVKIAKENSISTQKLVQIILEQAIEKRENAIYDTNKKLHDSVVDSDCNEDQNQNIEGTDKHDSIESLSSIPRQDDYALAS